MVTSRSGYPKKRTLRLTEDFCLIVFKLRNICADNYRKKAFEDYYKGETLPGAVAITCSIVTGFFLNSLGLESDHCHDVVTYCADVDVSVGVGALKTDF